MSFDGNNSAAAADKLRENDRFLADPGSDIDHRVARLRPVLPGPIVQNPVSIGVKTRGVDGRADNRRFGMSIDPMSRGVR